MNTLKTTLTLAVLLTSTEAFCFFGRTQRILTPAETAAVIQNYCETRVLPRGLSVRSGSLDAHCNRQNQRQVQAPRRERTRSGAGALVSHDPAPPANELPLEEVETASAGGDIPAAGDTSAPLTGGNPEPNIADEDTVTAAGLGQEEMVQGGQVNGPNPCDEPALTANIPNGSGSHGFNSEDSLGTYRENATNQLVAGNIPSFLRDLAPVRLAQGDERTCMGHSGPITTCRMRQPIAIGNDRDYVHTPISITEAAQVFRQWGFTIGTPSMVNAAIDQADYRVIGAPQGTNRMTSPWRFNRYNSVLQGQMPDRTASYAGSTKQYVLTNSLSRSGPGFQAPTLYGWLRSGNRNYWQQGSVQHAGNQGAYVDYSQIPQPFANFAAVGGQWYSMTELLSDPGCARTLNAARGGGQPINTNILNAFHNPNITPPRAAVLPLAEETVEEVPTHTGAFF